MPTEKYGDMPPRTPLSVPFPLQLGNDYDLGPAEALPDAIKPTGANPGTLPGRVPPARAEHEPRA